MPAGLTIGKLVAAVERRGYRVTAPTLRFWEARGLVVPERTASGYRHYDASDVDRVETICRLQSDTHMPLAAIADYLDALDRGLEPALPDAAPPEPPRVGVGESETEPGDDGGMLELTADELCRAAGIDAEFLSSLQSYGLLADGEHFDRTAARIAAAARVLAEHGIEPRHLRPFSAAAERELALVDAVIAPATRTLDGSPRGTSSGAVGDAEQGGDGVPPDAEELAAACGQLHAALLMAKLPGRY
ncbi:transcriptional regulator FtsR [Spelaeicoccus albus]|uniref:DNA-binding transcriptional MerR regulator n=1 Tax=Spelaeicoccus albus TaxID=1280376 RepID=A0A7Z0D507_9MICO|nr:MerR family transcriptional regulator [Spelaeicoccus albus]NYI69014.1 DNA-binding transcriptional MerR regulator [Spelaeicoccus albus]